MYFLWKRSGFIGSISEMARQLGYRDASPVNRMLHELMDEGYVVERPVGSKVAYKLTGRGRRSINLLVLKDFSLLFLIVFGLAVVYAGFIGLFFGASVPPVDLVVLGTVSILFVILAREQIRQEEEQLWQGPKELVLNGRPVRNGEVE